MKLTAYNTSLPNWLLNNINKMCKCGAHIADDGPMLETQQYTQRFCINPRCPYHMAQKMDILAKRFDITNFGPETALSLCMHNNYNNHLEILRKWFPDAKPKVQLWEVGSMAMIYGYDNSWKEMLLGKKSFAEYFDKTMFIHGVIAQNEEYLKYCETFFDVEEPLSSDVIYIMMTGSVNGFSNRAMFIKALNTTYGDCIQIIDAGKRVGNVSYLVKEESTVDHSKSDLAINNGIPIITPTEFTVKIDTISSYKREKEKGVK